ncbi:MAG: hypothetical protein M3457_20430 [Chloroflexota bacterium]|nr:hypothetical protein [Chloroflexota bacterium]
MYTVESAFGTRLSRRTAMKGILAASAAGAFAVRGGIGAFAQDATPAGAYPEVVIVATEYAFDIPATIKGGWTTVTLDNQGMMDHHAMLMRVNDGSTIDDLAAALQGPDFGAVFGVSASVGGPMAGPGGRGSVIANLEPGQYMAICVIPDDQGVPHYALGMAEAFDVTESVVAAEAPVADARIELVEMMFHGTPAEIAAGPALWEVANIGVQLHEMFVAQLAPGVTFEQVSAMLLTPPEATPEGMDHASPEAAMMAPPFTNVGGVAPMNPGYTNYAPFEFAAGEYFAVCFVPDPESGASHAALGMIMGFTVA